MTPVTIRITQAPQETPRTSPNRIPPSVTPKVASTVRNTNFGHAMANSGGERRGLKRMKPESNMISKPFGRSDSFSFTPPTPVRPRMGGYFPLLNQNDETKSPLTDLFSLLRTVDVEYISDESGSETDNPNGLRSQNNSFYSNSSSEIARSGSEMEIDLDCLSLDNKEVRGLLALTKLDFRNYQK